MKKTKVLAFLMAATMLASCGKTPVEESPSSASDTTMVSDPSVSIMDVGEGTYTDLEVGSVFSFGTYNGQAINWIVVSKESDSCDTISDIIVSDFTRNFDIAPIDIGIGSIAIYGAVFIIRHFQI